MLGEKSGSVWLAGKYRKHCPRWCHRDWLPFEHAVSEESQVEALAEISLKKTALASSEYTEARQKEV